MSDAATHFGDKLNHETDAWDLRQALEVGEKIVVIDTRSREAYDQEHIPHAINLPHREMNRETTQNFDQQASYVTYCDGIGCNASTKGALLMAQLGFQTKELIGGIDWWKRDGYATERAVVEIKK